MKCTDDGRGPQRDQLRRHGQRIGLILIQRLHRAARSCDVNHDARACEVACHLAGNVRQWHAALKLQPLHHPHYTGLQPRVVEVGVCHMHSELEGEAAGACFKMRGQRHQPGLACTHLLGLHAATAQQRSRQHSRHCRSIHFCRNTAPVPIPHSTCLLLASCRHTRSTLMPRSSNGAIISSVAPVSVTSIWISDTGQISAGLPWPSLVWSATAIPSRACRCIARKITASSASSVVAPRSTSSPTTFRKTLSRYT